MEASEVEAVGAVLAFALREIDEDNFANWLKEHSVQRAFHLMYRLFLFATGLFSIPTILSDLKAVRTNQINQLFKPCDIS